MLTFKKHSGIYTLTVYQNVPISLDEAWEFLSSPQNLKEITPDHMGFDITSDLSQKKMYPGQIITYKVSPVAGIKTNWCTEITHVKDKEFFVDEQRFGPYAMWHHEHWVSPIEGGTRMMDKVSYKVPFGVLGDIAHAVFIKNQLKTIFEYRFQKLEELFGVMQ